MFHVNKQSCTTSCASVPPRAKWISVLAPPISLEWAPDGRALILKDTQAHSVAFITA